jgi:hypothetical protein
MILVNASSAAELRHRSNGHAPAKPGDHDPIAEEAGHSWTKLADGSGELTKAWCEGPSTNAGRFSRAVLPRTIQERE